MLLIAYMPGSTSLRRVQINPARVCGPRRGVQRVLICLVLLVAGLGCAAEEPTPYGGTIYPLSEQVRATIHSLTIAANPAVAKVELRRPWVKSEAAGRGAVAGAQNATRGTVAVGSIGGGNGVILGMF